MDFFFISLILLASIVYVFSPLFRSAKDKSSFNAKNRIQEGLLYDKNTIYQHIIELDFDHDLGNIDESDYQKTRNELKKQVGTVIKEIKGDLSKTESKSESPAQSRFCRHCGKKISKNDKYCPFCGQKCN